MIELRDFPYATFGGFRVCDPALSDAPLDSLGRLFDEPAGLIGEDGAFLIGDGAGLLVICEAGFVPRLLLSWCLHGVMRRAKIQLQ